ncbi:MAG TPA: alpha/beta hydrolase [Thermomicrobiales bacterium]|jgi:pimeloyl-ACP methyl ester carboxylesterase
MTATVRTGRLAVPGATLHYEVRGNGPALLMIAGGGGDAGYYTPVADLLADGFTVITYDRRGNSRSPLKDPPRDLVMAEQSADARALLDAVAGGRGTVFGNSGGAVIALDLAARAPHGVSAFIAHEPPVLDVLPDAAEWRAFFAELQTVRQRDGWYAAWGQFAATVGQEDRSEEADGGQPWDEATFARVGGNLEFLLTHEVAPFVAFTPDRARITANGARVIFAGGEKSRPYYYCRAGQILAAHLGAEYVEFPGHHNGYLDHPQAFAATLRATLCQISDR